MLNSDKDKKITHINHYIQKISKRAERLDPRQQYETFVSLGDIEGILLNTDNRVIYGRRGTGKTHVLSYISASVKESGDIAISIDMRTIGSSGSIFNDNNLTLCYRATRLLRDFITAVHDGILDAAKSPDTDLKSERISIPLKNLDMTVKSIFVTESVERRTTDKSASMKHTKGGFNISASLIGSKAELNGEGKISKSEDEEFIEKGHTRLSVSMGESHKCLKDIAAQTKKRIWILVDEWSSIPEELQPYLADFIRRAIFPIRNYSVHIAAIEQRSKFREVFGAETLGIELGSDAAADINLDDHLVFENAPERSVAFFKELLYKHIASEEGFAEIYKSADVFAKAAFTQDQTLQELVRACEGVPRDAISIIQIAATQARKESISIKHIRNAAKDWYERDKASFVNTNPNASKFLQWIILEVIGKRKARAFLVRSDEDDELMARLFDERILHIAKRSYSTHDEPGIRYRVWKIDYGCYVDLINTSRAPTLYLTDDDLTVPDDDYRAIRGCILSLKAYQESQKLSDDPALSSMGGVHRLRQNPRNNVEQGWLDDSL